VLSTVQMNTVATATMIVHNPCRIRAGLPAYIARRLHLRTHLGRLFSLSFFLIKSFPFPCLRTHLASVPPASSLRRRPRILSPTASPKITFNACCINLVFFSDANERSVFRSRPRDMFRIIGYDGVMRYDGRIVYAAVERKHRIGRVGYSLC